MLRKLNTLFLPSIKKADCIVQICTFLEYERKFRQGKCSLFGEKYKEIPDRDFMALKYNIKLFSENKISVKDDFSMILIITVNGYLENEEHIKYLRSINGMTVGNNVNIITFQRPNIGYQWGGLYDIWLRYKDINCGWFGSLEHDHYFRHSEWFDIAMNHMGRQPPNVKNIGMNQTSKSFNPYEYCGKKIPKEAWKDKNNEVIEGIREDDLIHSSGGGYFCHRDLLRDMENAYGCFTFSIDNDYIFDGIVLGEVGFCQKIKSLGYDWTYTEPNFIEPMGI